MEAPGAVKMSACARSGGRGGEDEVARGRGRRRTGERPGGVVVQGGRGGGGARAVLGDGGGGGGAMGDDGGAAQIKKIPKCWRKAEVKRHI